MTLFEFLGLIPALLGMTVHAPPEEQVVRRVVIRNEVILRVPVRPRLSQAIEWVEQKGPKCLDSGRIAGAMLSGTSSIDFVMRDRQRIRAQIDSDCPALDFYDGFYLQPEDDRICAKRESVRVRSGGSCRIERFKTLVPQLKR